MCSSPSRGCPGSSSSGACPERVPPPKDKANGRRGAGRATEERVAIDTTRKNITLARSEHSRSLTDSQIHPSFATGRVIQIVLHDRYANRTCRVPAHLTAATGDHIPAESRVEPETEMSLAAGTTVRATGYREHGPARVQAAHAQQAQAGSAARAPRGAPVKKEAKPHRKCASL